MPGPISSFSRRVREVARVLSLPFGEDRPNGQGWGGGNAVDTVSVARNISASTSSSSIAQYINNIWVAENWYESKLEEFDTALICEIVVEGSDPDEVKKLIKDDLVCDDDRASALTYQIVGIYNAANYSDDVEFGVAEILEIHSLVMVGCPKKMPGQYRRVDVRPAGSTRMYLPYQLVEQRLEKLVKTTTKLRDELVGKKLGGSELVVEVAALVATFFSEFLLIHPFMDGNGRTARLVTNVLLRSLLGIRSSLFYFGTNDYESCREIYMSDLVWRWMSDRVPSLLAAHIMLAIEADSAG